VQVFLHSFLALNAQYRGLVLTAFLFHLFIVLLVQLGYFLVILGFDFRNLLLVFGCQLSPESLLIVFESQDSVLEG
jgi:hypothetical protein